MRYVPLHRILHIRVCDHSASFPCSYYILSGPKHRFLLFLVRLISALAFSRGYGRSRKGHVSLDCAKASLIIGAPVKLSYQLNLPGIILACSRVVLVSRHEFNFSFFKHWKCSSGLPFDRKLPNPKVRAGIDMDRRISVDAPDRTPGACQAVSALNLT